MRIFHVDKPMVELARTLLSFQQNSHRTAIETTNEYSQFSLG